MLNGYKTYIVSVLGLVWAVTGWVFFGLPSTDAIQMIQVALTAMGLRSAL